MVSRHLLEEAGCANEPTPRCNFERAAKRAKEDWAFPTNSSLIASFNLS